MEWIERHASRSRYRRHRPNPAVCGATEEYRYDALNRLNSVVKDGVQIDQRYYDGATRVVQSGPGGDLPQGYAAALNQGVAQNLANGKETRLNRYNANGQMTHQRTLKSDNALQSDMVYTGRDAAGNLTN